jgi:hypothetical protein
LQLAKSAQFKSSNNFTALRWHSGWLATISEERELAQLVGMKSNESSYLLSGITPIKHKLKSAEIE